MHDQRSPAELEQRADSAILRMLIHDDGGVPWAVDEVVREVGDRIETDDSLARLYGAGLIHRCGDFVFATRPAVAASRLELG